MVETGAVVVRRWALVVPLADAAMVARLRALRGVEVQVADESLWVRGETVVEQDVDLLRLLPGVRPYLVGHDGLITRLGEQVPALRLPTGGWQSLETWFTLELPPARATWANPPRPLALQLVRCGQERPAMLLATTIEALAEYANDAPQWRLEALAFVADEKGVVVTRGTPLPVIRGLPLVLDNGIAVMAGWTWQPAVDPVVLRRRLGLNEGDVAWFGAHESLPNGNRQEPILNPSCSVIRADDWVRLTRAAARRTHARLAQVGREPRGEEAS